LRKNVIAGEEREKKADDLSLQEREFSAKLRDIQKEEFF
jgi:hypothetical protein